MSKGGSRNRSGPAADPASGRSEQRGLIVTALPSEGYTKRAPAFPLPKIARYRVELFELSGGKTRPEKVADARLANDFRKRELAVWAEAWKTPQAAAWALEPWRWPTVAEFCRLKTIVELEPDANAALVAQLHRFRDQIGLTPAGLRENGWAIAANQLAAKAAEKQPAAGTTARPRRLRSADAQ